MAWSAGSSSGSWQQLYLDVSREDPPLHWLPIARYQHFHNPLVLLRSGIGSDQPHASVPAVCLGHLPGKATHTVDALAELHIRQGIPSDPRFSLQVIQKRFHSI